MNTQKGFGHYLLFLTIAALVVGVVGVTTIRLTAAATNYTISKCSKAGSLQLGSRGACVKVLQEALNKWGKTSSIAVDGVFGKRTQTAVKDFQRLNPISSVTGKVGKQTWTYIGKIGASVSVASAQDISSTPFTTTSKVCYRIPAITRDDSGTIYAFAERRHGNGEGTGRCSDNGDIEIVMRKLGSNGRWSSETVVVDKVRNRVTNPVPIYNSSLHKLFLIYTYKDNTTQKVIGLFQKTSTDGGNTWKTETVNRNTNGFLMGDVGQSGPGHGIVIEEGSNKGRMVIAAWKGGLYSDNGGVTWQRGYKAENVNEGTVAAVSANALLACHRTNSNVTDLEHLCAISYDGAKTISQLSAVIYNVPNSTQVEGSLLALKGKYKGYTLYSLPSSTTNRKGMSIYASSLSNNHSLVSWQNKQWFKVTTEDSYAAYSDMVQTSDDTIAILYESGKDYKKITYAKYSLDVILQAAGLIQ